VYIYWSTETPENHKIRKFIVMTFYRVKRVKRVKGQTLRNTSVLNTQFDVLV
jgi:hypothetical protein